MVLDHAGCGHGHGHGCGCCIALWCIFFSFFFLNFYLIYLYLLTYLGMLYQHGSITWFYSIQTVFVCVCVCVCLSGQCFLFDLLLWLIWSVGLGLSCDLSGVGQYHHQPVGVLSRHVCVCVLSISGWLAVLLMSVFFSVCLSGAGQGTTNLADGWMDGWMDRGLDVYFLFCLPLLM
ncbi:hypothetical protein VTN02DRAFT_213 [Thermoascus thermophilus]